MRLSCAALPEALLESELFGHEKAAFTGADRRKIGYFEAAQGGTLLLDEIGEMPLAMQAKLLRVLESRRVARIGGTQEIELDVRVVCATHRDLQAEVAAGRFRQDLYYRISTFVLRVPPLRERRRDRAARASLRAAGRRAHGGAGAALRAGGDAGARGARVARQPARAAQRRGARRRAGRGRRHRGRAPAGLRGGGAEGAAPPRARARPRRARGRRRVRRRRDDAGAPRGAGEEEHRGRLAAEGNNQTRAAKRLGISRRALLYKLDKYDIRR